ncbi:MAG: phytase [Candidatus Marinimicrobia bacterium]|nr:phytase [Candidatus Neomarinimicrobiota bacterium]
MKKIIFMIILFIIMIQFCKKTEIVGFTITAWEETDEMAAGIHDDAADDPAIWINDEDRSQSIVFGTNKIDQGGVYAFDLKGNKLTYYKIGAINNIDVRYGLTNGLDTIDFLGGSNRSDTTLTFMKIDSRGVLTPTGKIKSKVDEVYGFCLHHDKKSNEFYAFVVSSSGQLEQWELGLSEDLMITGELVRQIEVGSKCEGLVADDELNILYVGEEENCIWKYSTDATTGESREKLVMSGAENSKIAYDIEGLGLYYMPNGEGYLIASSQGNFSYALFDRKKGHYLTSFSVVDGTIDGVQETDGLEILNLSLNEEFDSGLLVVQDGYNYNKDKKYSQNFKYIRWQDIVNSSDVELKINNEYDIR